MRSASWNRPSSLESFGQRQATDPKPHLVVTDCVFRPPAENQVAEMRMSVEAAEVGLAEIH
jgi:hypothetical protein